MLDALSVSTTDFIVNNLNLAHSLNEMCCESKDSINPSKTRAISVPSVPHSPDRAFATYSERLTLYTSISSGPTAPGEPCPTWSKRVLSQNRQRKINTQIVTEFSFFFAFPPVSKLMHKLRRGAKVDSGGFLVANERGAVPPYELNMQREPPLTLPFLTPLESCFLRGI